MKKINTQVAIIIAALIIGGSLYAVQVNKQNSIERQSKAKIAQDNRTRIADALKDTYRRLDLDDCLQQAEDEYWSYVELNGSKDDDGTVWAADKYWDEGEKIKKNKKDVCFKRYN